MTRARTQFLILVIYSLFGTVALFTPGFIFDALGTSAFDRSPAALLLMRVFGAASLGVALALFFFIADVTSGRRMMRAAAALEIGVIAAAILSLGADDLDTRAGLVIFISAGALALLNLFGGFLAPVQIEKEKEPDES
ncbi:MAG: hypothetical protein H0V47_02935 [Chloroflexia bacterium]|jgi:hypothetical protein|nr:hypothetical protein [Chloroflexia bacterium]